MINILHVLNLTLERSAKVMPQRIICKHCGTILYDGADLKPPDEVAQKLDGKCPKCGRKLSFIPIDVDVRPAKQP